MTDAAWIWVVATLQVITAFGFAWFWVSWFRSHRDERWMPGSRDDHRAPFVVSDSALAVILVASAVLLVLDEPLGESLALVSGGMLVFLGLLDAAYFSRNGMFDRERDGLLNLGVVVGLLTVGTLLVASFA